VCSLASLTPPDMPHDTQQHRMASTNTAPACVCPASHPAVPRPPSPSTTPHPAVPRPPPPSPSTHPTPPPDGPYMTYYFDAKSRPPVGPDDDEHENSSPLAHPSSSSSRSQGLARRDGAAPVAETWAAVRAARSRRYRHAAAAQQQ
jgi:hypothetical protein